MGAKTSGRSINGSGVRRGVEHEPWLADAGVPVSEYMQHGLPHVRPNMAADAAIVFMWKSNLVDVAVLDEHERPVGVISLAELAASDEEAASSAREAVNDGDAILTTVQNLFGLHNAGGQRTSVEDIMMPEVPAVEADLPLARAAARMLQTRREWLVVVDSDRAAVGQLTTKDIVRWLAEETGHGYRAISGELLTADGARVRDVMRPVLSVPRDAPMVIARGLMNTIGLDDLPVVEGSRLVGVVSRHDIEALVGSDGEHEGWLYKLTVEQVMTAPGPVCAPHEPLKQVAPLFQGGSPLTSVFVTHNGRVVGVVHAEDALRVGDHADERTPALHIV